MAELMSNLWDLMLPVISAIITAAITWGAVAFQRWSGMEVEAKHREALHRAILTGIGFAMSRVTGAGPATTPNAVVSQASEYVRTSVPDALGYFGLDKKPAMLNDMIASKVEETHVLAQPNLASSAGAAGPNTRG